MTSSQYSINRHNERKEIGKMSYLHRITQRDLMIPAQDDDFVADEVYSQKFMKYCHSKKSLVIKSPTGSGKTRFLNQFIQRNPHLIYIAVSCRRTLAEELAKLPGFVNYMDIPGGKLIQEHRIVIQAESVWRLDMRYYEDRMDRLVFIMDEFSSLVQQFTSVKTMGYNHNASAVAFGLFQQKAHKVIALDADFTNAEVDLLKERRSNLYIVHNKHDVHAGDSVVLHETEEMLLDETIKRLANGQKLYIVSTNSANHTEAIHKYLKDKGNIGLCMTSSTPDADKRQRPELFLYTPISIESEAPVLYMIR